MHLISSLCNFGSSSVHFEWYYGLLGNPSCIMNRLTYCFFTIIHQTFTLKWSVLVGDLQSAGVEFPPRAENDVPLFTPPQTQPITAPSDISIYDIAAVEASLQSDASDLRYFMHCILYSFLLIPTLCSKSMDRTVEFSCLLSFVELCSAKVCKIIPN